MQDGATVILSIETRNVQWLWVTETSL